MPYIERIITLKNGPPWGFRLQDGGMDGLMVSRIRKRSPAEESGLHEKDRVLSINSVSTNGMSHSSAVHVIDGITVVLNLNIGRNETRQMANITCEIPDSSIASSNSSTSAILDRVDSGPVIGKENKIPIVQGPQPYVPLASVGVPAVPKPYQPPGVAVQSPQPYEPFKLVQKEEELIEQKDCNFNFSQQPHRTDGYEEEEEDQIAPASFAQSYSSPATTLPLSKLFREHDIPEPKPGLKKQQFGDSAFYFDNDKKYPTAEEQISLARQVAISLTEPANLGSRGASMFQKRRKRMEKFCVTNYDEDEDEPQPLPVKSYHQPDSSDEDSDDGTFQPAMSNPYNTPMMTQPQRAAPNIPPAPPLPLTGGFIRPNFKAPESPRPNASQPEQCFSIAAALHNSSSRGAQIFAKRKARSHKWEIEAPEPEVVEPQPKFALTLGPSTGGPMGSGGGTSQSHLVLKQATGVGPAKSKVPSKLGGSSNNSGGWSNPPKLIQASVPPSQPKGTEWKPVQFKIPQKG